MNLKKLTFVLIAAFIMSTVFGQTKKHAVQIILENEVNDNKVSSLGYMIESAIVDEKTEDFMKLMDVNGFKTRIESNVISNGNTYEKEVFKGIVKGLESLPNKILSSVKNGGYYDFISYKYNQEERYYSILLRMFSEETGINYHEYRVSKNGGEFKFNDIYVYTSGEYLSETITRIFMVSIIKNKKKHLFGHDNLKELIKINKSLKMASTGKVVKAYDLILTVKGKLKKGRYYHLIKSQIAALVSDDTYKTSMEEMLKQFPNDNKLALNYIDYYLLNNEFDKTIKALNELQQKTEDDFLARKIHYN